MIEDINNLNNIIAYENANVLLAKANAPVQNKDFPGINFFPLFKKYSYKIDDILSADIPADKDFTQIRDTVLSPEQFQQLATSIINVIIGQFHL